MRLAVKWLLRSSLSSSSCCRLGRRRFCGDWREAHARAFVYHCYYCAFQPSDEGGVERQRAFLWAARASVSTHSRGCGDGDAPSRRMLGARGSQLTAPPGAPFSELKRTISMTPATSRPSKHEPPPPTKSDTRAARLRPRAFGQRPRASPTTDGVSPAFDKPSRAARGAQSEQLWRRVLDGHHAAGREGRHERHRRRRATGAARSIRVSTATTRPRALSGGVGRRAGRIWPRGPGVSRRRGQDGPGVGRDVREVGSAFVALCARRARFTMDRDASTPRTFLVSSEAQPRAAAPGPQPRSSRSGLVSSAKRCSTMAARGASRARCPRGSRAAAGARGSRGLRAREPVASTAWSLTPSTRPHNVDTGQHARARAGVARRRTEPLYIRNEARRRVFRQQAPGGRGGGGSRFFTHATSGRAPLVGVEDDARGGARHPLLSDRRHASARSSG